MVGGVSAETVNGNTGSFCVLRMYIVSAVVVLLEESEDVWSGVANNKLEV